MTRTGNRRWIVVPGLLGLVLLLMLGTISAGLRLPGLSQLTGLPGFGTLDYRSLDAGDISPLRPAYVDELLGTDLVGDVATALPDSFPTGSRRVGGSKGPVGTPTTTSGAPSLQVEEQSFTNDDIGSPRVITSLPFAARTDNTRATRVAGDPSSCSQTGGTAWYRYTARRAGVLFADTIGSDHATAIGVFSSNGPSSLTQVGCATGATGNAQLGFSVTKGGTYLFQVAGVFRGGSLVFRLSALGRTSLVSTETAAGSGARFTGLSGNGQVVAFSSQVALGCPFDVRCPSQVFAVDRRTGVTTLVSGGPSGNPGNGASLEPTLSDDGRYVGFASVASDLVAGDRNETWDYFVHDRRTGSTVRASVDSAGDEGTSQGDEVAAVQTAGGSISPDGRYASFWTDLGGLAGGDGQGSTDAFVRDLRTGITTIESVTPAGEPGGTSEISTDTRISRGGRYVAFISGANLDPDQQCSPCRNVYIRDRLRGTTTMISVGRNDFPDGKVLAYLDMSADARVVAWSTTSALGDPADTNEIQDVYVVDLRRDRIPRRVSLSATGQQQESSESTSPLFGGLGIDLSGDGNRLVFHSDAPNVVSNDENAVVDVFLRDLRTGSVTRVSTSSTGVEGNGDSYLPRLSHDGRVLVYESESDNLVSGDDDNKLPDAFVHDLTGV